MYGSKEFNKLVIQTDQIHRLQSVVPETVVSRQFPNIAYVPWELDVCTKLEKLGFKRIVSPVFKSYAWSGNKTPYKKQAEITGFCSLNPRGFVITGIGSGKTNGTLWAADYLMSIGTVRKCLIITTLSTVDVVWSDTLFCDYYHRRHAVLTGTAERRQRLFADTNNDFYIINHDAFSIIRNQFLQRNDIDLIIIDESTAYKNAGTKRFQRLEKAIIMKQPKYVWALTATPTPNEPTDAWGQAKLLGLHKGVSFSRFKDLTMRKVTNFRWEPLPEAHKYVANILTPSIRFATSECVDLPPCIYSARKAYLTGAQMAMFKEMTKKLTVDFANGQANAVNEADKQNKLLQIACGFIYSRDANNEVVTQHVDPTARLAVLDEILDTLPGKAIIFVPYTELIGILVKHLTPRGNCATVYGEISRNDRVDIFRDFQQTNNIKYIIAHPKTMAHGVTLTAAATIIWYAPYASNEVYEQANGRINRPSQVNTTNIVHIESTELEKRIFAKLARRQNTQGTLLDYLSELQNARTTY